MKIDGTRKITSTANERIKSVRRLHKKKERDKTNLFIIEGHRELAAALESGIEVIEVFLHTDAVVDPEKIELFEELEDSSIKITPVSKRVLEKISYREDSSGFVAVAKKPALSLERFPKVKDPLYLVIDSIEKPGNIGALMRTADGAGVSGVIVTGETSDLFSPNTVRSSLGALFTLHIALAASVEAIAFLRRRGVKIVATTPSAEKLYTDTDMTCPTAVVCGSEDRGLETDWLDAADERVRIMMRGNCDSLNVSASTAVLLYEALRQRESAKKNR